jgi:glucokinase
MGGTKVAAGLVQTDGRVLAAAKSTLPKSVDSEEVFGSVRKVVAELLAYPQSHRIDRVGIGSCGPVNIAKGTINPLNIAAWDDFPLVAKVAEEVDHRWPVTMTGDGPAIAAAEHWLGAAIGARSAICMVVSTGIGGGLIIDDKIVVGPSGNAGHIGHIVVEPDGPPCNCGSRGCAEAIASGPATVRWAQSQGWQGENAEKLAEDARNGNEIALAAFDRCGKAVADIIASTAALIDTKLAVIGGGIAETGPLLFDPIRKYLKTHYAGPDFTQTITVKKAEAGPYTGVIGAARLAFARTDQD